MQSLLRKSCAGPQSALTASLHKRSRPQSTIAAAASATVMATNALVVDRVPCLSDNYAWVLHEPTQKLTAVVDPSEAEPVQAMLNSKGYKLDYIFNTHHHWDHTGGNLALKQKFPGLKIIGPKADEARIPGIDESYADGDSFKFGPLEVKVFDTPGHTRGHITFWMPGAEAVFPGDTLFSLGCGRVFEGTPQQMWSSLSKFLPLPDSTSVFCAHEYTQSNARFAVSVDPTTQRWQHASRKLIS